MNRTLRRPMFRRGGSTSSAGTGITSGLQSPRQGYEHAGDVKPFDINTASIEELQEYAKKIYQPKPRDNKDLFIDFGLDMISSPSSGSMIQNIGSSGQKAYNQYRTDNRALDKQTDDRQADMFTTLIGAQAKIKGSEGAGKTYRDLEVAKQLAKIIPEMYEIQQRVDLGTETEADIIRMKVLRGQKNKFSKTDLATEMIIKMYQASNPMALGEKMDDLWLADKKAGGANKYTTQKDEQLLQDAVSAIKKMFESFENSYATGGRAGYANGELVEEQVTETVDPGPDASMQEENPISYDQLRARLPQEITDDIIHLMSNSVEALEDFAMISTQQQVDQFNKKYSVNLVLPAEA